MKETKYLIECLCSSIECGKETTSFWQHNVNTQMVAVLKNLNERIGKLELSELINHGRLG